jgi:hypothetical protein
VAQLVAEYRTWLVVDPGLAAPTVGRRSGMSGSAPDAERGSGMRNSACRKRRHLRTDDEQTTTVATRAQLAGLDQASGETSVAILGSPR